jgi:hypothetical protein
MKIDNAERKLEKFNGKWMYLFHVVATVSDLSGTTVIYDERILAQGWAGAREYAWGEIFDALDDVHVIEMHSRGPKGRKLYSSAGYTTVVGRMIERGWGRK